MLLLRVGIIILSIYMFDSTVFASANVYDKVAKANKLLNQQKYEDALKLYTDAQIDMPDSPELSYNIGVTYYRLGRYEKALEAFRKSCSTEDIKLEAKAWYNMGNCLVQMGNLREAIEYYKHSLELNPDDKDAKFNIEYVQRKIKELLDKEKKRQEEQKKNPLYQDIKKLEKIIKEQAENIANTKDLIQNRKKGEEVNEQKENIIEKERKIKEDTENITRKFQEIKRSLHSSQDKNNKSSNKINDLSKRIDNVLQHLNSAQRNMDSALNSLESSSFDKGKEWEEKALEDLINARKEFEGTKRSSPSHTKSGEKKNKNKESEKKNDTNKNKPNKNKEEKSNRGKGIKPKPQQKDKHEKMNKEDALLLLKRLETLDKKLPQKRIPTNAEEYVEHDW